MDAEQTQVLEKVRKLLALSASPSEAEAAAALAKARILLAKHGLSIADVQTADGVQEAVLLEKKRLRAWESVLFMVVCQATFTTALRYKGRGVGRLMVIGREVNIVSAKELFAYLHRVILILGRAYSSAVDHVESFRLGVAHRIGERLVQQTGAEHEPQTGSPPATPSDARADAAETALIRQADATAAAENAAFIRRTYGRTTTTRPTRMVEPDSYNHGRAVGDTVNLNRQIGER